MRDQGSRTTREPHGGSLAGADDMPDPLDKDLELSREHETRRVLRWALVPILLMALMGVVYFDGDWTYLAQAGMLLLLVGIILYLRPRPALPSGYEDLVARILRRGRLGLPPPDSAAAAVARLVGLQDELDAIYRRPASPSKRLAWRLGIWPGVLGAVAWLAAAVVALAVHDVKAALVALVMSLFFASVAGLSSAARGRRRRAVAILEDELAEVRAVLRAGVGRDQAGAVEAHTPE
jgi:hypothetical protein